MSVLNDTRDYLRKAMLELADSDASDEDLERIIARARTTAQIASAVVATVKVECEALRTAHALELLPVGSAVPAQMRQLLGSDK